jgi:hypothetical protein
MGNTNTNGAENSAEPHRQDGPVMPAAERPLPSNTHHPREGWEEQFATMAQSDDDALLDDAALVSKWDEREWRW